MIKEVLLKELKESIGNKDPILFFEKFVDVFSLLFDKIDRLEKKVKLVQNNSALAIKWEPKLAADMLVKEIEVLRKDKDTYASEISELKRAYAEGEVVKDYVSFCTFWQDTLGWHPFLDYDQ